MKDEDENMSEEELRQENQKLREALAFTRQQMSKALAQARQDAEHYQQSCRSLQWALTTALDALRQAQTESLREWAENVYKISDTLSLAD
jgi:phosphoenolpyruvate-protein kinase (PTS system EI component)